MTVLRVIARQSRNDNEAISKLSINAKDMNITRVLRLPRRAEALLAMTRFLIRNS